MSTPAAPIAAAPIAAVPVAAPVAVSDPAAGEVAPLLLGATLRIVLTVDDAFTEGFLCVVRSVLDHTDRPVAFTVISSQSDATWMRSAQVLDSWAARFDVVRPPELALAYARCGRLLDAEVKRPYYLRLWMADLLPRLDRVLYLDCDLIVRRSLGALWDTKLENVILAAIDDPVFLEPHEAPFLSAHGGRYFNSGILLIDLDRWRSEDMTARTLDWVAIYQRAGEDRRWRQHWDQSPLNMACRSHWMSVGPTWNFTHMHRAEHAAAYGLTPTAFETVARDPAIFHFIGPGKPWDHPDMNAFAGEYTAIAHRVRADWSRVDVASSPLPARTECDLTAFAALVFEAVAARHSPVRFIQIGACRDVFDDPVYRFVKRETWTGLLLEPAPHRLDRHREMYSGLPTIAFADLAIGTAGDRTLDHIVDRHGMEPDVLLLDTEMHDAATLGRSRPSAIHVVVRHVPSPDRDRIVRKLKRLGYFVMADGDVAIAIQPSLLSDAGVADGFSRLPTGLIR